MTCFTVIPAPRRKPAATFYSPTVIVIAPMRAAIAPRPAATPAAYSPLSIS